MVKFGLKAHLGRVALFIFHYHSLAMISEKYYKVAGLDNLIKKAARFSRGEARQRLMRPKDSVPCRERHEPKRAVNHRYIG